ncbi:hypothetical protein ACFL20_06910 [Spirochaetota bacterium]
MYRTIFISLFIVLMIVLFIISRKWKNITIDKLELLPGENLLFDDEECRVKLKAGPGIDILPKCYVRVTDRRIIIGQKTLGRKNMYMIRYIIHYTGMTAPDGFAGGALKTGYITYRTIPQEMKIMEEKETLLRIEPYGEKVVGVPDWLEIKTGIIDKYRGNLNIQ